MKILDYKVPVWLALVGVVIVSALGDGWIIDSLSLRQLAQCALPSCRSFVRRCPTRSSGNQWRRATTVWLSDRQGEAV